ncbi:hypothetical protein A2627_00315 [Candidatus Woesebacteria bacterium RIFCSPHIGHO2_01_FULL_39_28]|uniref:Uncharacterized protein n=1 Tax=Candidatus Woesebacteria bacterium RIFCSPHIGHO2_01_FULL_39_28 TaxID=1802496 RepID=A0A1F7YCM6_9BACT|nr:MAG: hypothetical protein A2627_00315 [Candidatus Woesebacteria bacterium RIFCSPHIGHO2_01_FULL_39_28]OGM56823.1 MAG: hypothetical protein A3A50_03840 [Candidatus Woesebacteria bacterium RIFCSPLOWO2_01_FULL_38_20]
MKTIDQVLNEKSNDYSPLEDEYFKSTGHSLSLDPNNPPAPIPTVKPLNVSVVIPAWNASSTILSCLTAIEESSFNIKHQNRLQVIVIDDGSTDKTWEIVKNNDLSLHFMAIRTQNLGQAKALNTGISLAEGDIIVSCDADMILNYYAIEHFVTRHELFPNVLLAGFRSNSSKNDLRVKSEFMRQIGSPRGTFFAGDERIFYSTSGWPDNMCLTSGHFKNLGNSKGLWMPDDEICEDPWRLSDLVFGALFSLSRNVYIKIGGYDERLQGWGSTDGLLAAKAIANGQYVIPVYAASGLHINHQFRTKNKQEEYAKNRKMFFDIIKTEKISSYTDWIKKAKKRIIDSFSRNPQGKFLKSEKENSTQSKTINFTKKLDDLLALGQYSKAYDILVKARLKSGSNHLLKLGKVLIGLNRYKEATDVLNEFPIELAIAQAASGLFAAAHKTLKNVVFVHPQSKELTYWYYTSTDTHIRQGSRYFRQEFYQIALRCFEAALINDPNNRKALNNRDKCLSRLS